jgi:transcriptional regulator with AAA-type ATPase domain/tetratricopeptide (TPR) repeat protein/ABC-type cobalamin transport system ATPase subunit
MQDTMSLLEQLRGDCAGIVAVRHAVSRLLERFSSTRRLPPILLKGETGTGKGLLARAIHDAGPRAAGPFVDVNCAAIPDTLLEAEMFGVARGAFTDAHETRPGLFRTAHRGTLFLDEIGLIPPGLQAKLLTAIEEQKVRRLGDTRSEAIDVWIIAATNADLALDTRAGRFREDLYHRLSVITLELPPLRERGDDILHLAELFLARACADYHLPPKTLTPDARAALLAYGWPGNVRELANVTERVALLSTARTLTADLLGLPRTGTAEPDHAPAVPRAISNDGERERLLGALREMDWNVSRAATRLGMNRNTLRYRIAKYGLVPSSQEGSPPPPPAEDQLPVPAPARPLAEHSMPTAAGMRWERRRLTLLYATVTTPAEGTAWLETTRVIETCIQKVESFAGRVEELSPMSVMAAFGLDALEEAPDRAALTALALHKVAERARAAGARQGVTLAIHTASFLVGHIGDRTELEAGAKRLARKELEALAASAAPDTIVVSAATARFLERRFDLQPTDPGADGAERTYRVMGREPAGFGRRRSRFVGRNEDLELLGRRFESALRGQGQVVGIAGTAGIGKSRLLFEFRERLAGRGNTYLEGRCTSYWSGVPYLPVIDLLRAGLRLREVDPPQVVARKVRFGLRLLGMDAVYAGPYVLHLLGVSEGTQEVASLSPEAVNVRTLQVLRQMALQSSRRRSLVLAVEDIQWMDSASAALLASLVESLVGAPILIIVTYRSGHTLPWADRSYVTQLSLQALDPGDSREVLGESGIPAAMVEAIVSKAGGNPLFLEELARAVHEGDAHSTVQVPDTVQEVLLARIGRLPEAPRRLLQTAAVLGREVSPRLLGAIWQEPDRLVQQLRELSRFEFIYESGGTAEAVYLFTHPLLQEVAYGSLLPDEREALHQRVGEALEAVYADRLDEATDLLAHHYSKTAQAAKAVAFLTKAAARAARGYAHQEAIAALDESLAHAERLPSPEKHRSLAALVLRRVESLSFLGRFSEALDQLLDTQPRAESLQDVTILAQHLFWLGLTHSYLGHPDRAVDSARRAIAAAERGGDTVTLGKAYALLAQECSWSGQPIEGVTHGRRAVELLERTDEQWWLGFAHWIVGINHIAAGHFEPALEAQARAQRSGAAIGDPRIQSYAAWTTGWIHALRGESDLAIAICQKALESSLDPVNTAMVTTHLGHAYLDKGDLERAMPLLEQAVAMMSRFQFRRLQGRALTFLAEGCLARAQLDRARDLGQEGLELMRAARYGYGEGWAQWVLGRIEAARGRWRDAEPHLREAHATFIAIEARFMAARVSTALAEVVCRDGRRAEAAQYLDEALRTFRALAVPRHEERAIGLANTLGLPIR